MSIQHFSVATAVQGRRVDIVGASVTGSTGGGGFAAAYELNSGGSERTAMNNGALASINTWLKSGSASDYEIRMTMQSGASFDTGSLGTWLNAGTSRLWTRAAGPGASTGTALLEIRLAAGGPVLDSASVTLARAL